MIFVPHFKLNAHVKSLVTRTIPYINILKAIIGTNWGQQKECILITDMTLIRSLFMYAAPIWFPNNSPSLIQNHKTTQNSVLRIATVCVKMTSIDHLYQETKLFHVQDDLSLISSQYLARALHPNNPSHSVVTSLSGGRNMKQTIKSRFLQCVAPHLSSCIPPLTDYGTTIKSLHTRTVSIFKSLPPSNCFPANCSGRGKPSYRPYRSTCDNFLLFSVAPSVPVVRG